MSKLEPVQASDFEELLAMRIEAMRESLEHLGRFDPIRARERLVASFVPKYMRHIVKDGQRVGLVTLRPEDGPEQGILRLDHLYLRPVAQRCGLGSWVLNWTKVLAREQGRDICLSVLQHSPANRFYLRHGFVKVAESEFDIDYRWSVLAEVAT
jgi:GNAT superfamily N-acetyltransferase